MNICGALRDLVPFVQFKKRDKHPWRSVNVSKVAGFKLAGFNWLRFNRDFNPLNASVALILKPVNWFALQINWLVSI